MKKLINFICRPMDLKISITDYNHLLKINKHLNIYIKGVCILNKIFKKNLKKESLKNNKKKLQNYS